MRHQQLRSSMSQQAAAANARWAEQKIPFELRFWMKVKIGTDEECWPWLAAINVKGYGHATTKDGRTITAHRLAWELYNDKQAPKGIDVAHDCHNRPCINPLHLHLATKSQNMLESAAIGRLSNQGNGKRGNLEKLTKEDILAIRASSETHVQAAKRFRVSRDNISAIRRRKSWKHI